jgi:hypothetical protein
MSKVSKTAGFNPPWTLALIAAGAALVAAIAASSFSASDQRSTAPRVTAAAAPFTRDCDSPRVVGRLHPNAERFAIRAGPLAFLNLKSFAKTAPRFFEPARPGAARASTILVRIQAGRVATVFLQSGAKRDASFVFDPREMNRDPASGYDIPDGSAAVRFIGCEDAPATYDGYILISGPGCYQARIHTDTQSRFVRTLAFGDTHCGRG